MNSAMPGPPPDPTDKDSIARARRAEYDASVDKRLTVLETRFDAILPTLATKADLAELRGEVAAGFERMRAEMALMSDNFHQEIAKLQQEMNKMFQRLLLWMVGIVLTSGLAFFAATTTITSMMFDTFRETYRPVQVQAAPVLQAPVQTVPLPPARK